MIRSRRAATTALCVVLGGCAPAAPAATQAVPSAVQSLVASAGAPAGTRAPAGAGSPAASASASVNAPDDRAGSLVYIAAWNVWVAAPDGTRARAITTDGTERDPYHDPTQADDGTILALRGSGALHRLDRRGRPLADPVRLPTLENGAQGLTVSPAGDRIAYVTTGFGHQIDPRFGTPTGTFIYGGVDVADLGGTSITGAAAPTLTSPSWVDDSRLVASDGVDLFVDDVGPKPARRWVSLGTGCLIEGDCPSGQGASADLSLPVVSGDGRLLVYGYKPYFGVAGRRVASLTAAPPAVPATRCVMPGQENLRDPGDFAPDGTAYAYDDTVFDPSTFDTLVGKGIWVIRLDLRAADCGASKAALLVPGGSQPDWGPAAP